MLHNPMAGFDAKDWKQVLDLISDQKAEIERLRAVLKHIRDYAGNDNILWELADDALRDAETQEAGQK